MKLPFVLMALIFSTACFSQKLQGTIHFFNGEKKDGIISLSNNHVKYRASKKAEKVKFECHLIDKVEFEGNNYFYYKPIEVLGKEKLLLVRQLYDGKVSLYVSDQTTFYMGPDGSMRGGQIDKYFVQKDEKLLTKIFPVGVLGNGSDKAMIEYFSDCPKLIELIKNRTFENYVKNHPDYKDKPKLAGRLTETIKYYNLNCLEE